MTNEMTWKEFKTDVDRHLAQKDISEDEPIWYIDISFPSKDDFDKDRLNVILDKNSGIAI